MINVQSITKRKAILMLPKLIQVRALVFPVILALLVSAFAATPVLADDGAPPPADAPAEVSPPAEDGGAAPDAPPVDPVSEAEAPPVEETFPAEPADEVEAPPVPSGEVPPVEPASEVEALPAETAAEPETLPELLEQLPEGTEVIVTDETGEALPLVTEEAAQTIVKGDPMWCPAGAAPKAGMGGCSPSFTGFTNDGSPDNGLIAWLNDNANALAVSKAGVIWVAYNYAAVGGETGPIDINPGTVGGIGSTIENFALTIQGGWSGTPGSTALYVDPLNPGAPQYSTFTVPLWITSWTGAITLKNIIVDDSAAPVTLGADKNALEVGTAGSITLDTVKVQNNTDMGNALSGAFLDNRTSSSGAAVTIKNGLFNKNEGYGLWVFSDGIVTINNIGANGNGYLGANINNSFDKDKAVTFTGFQQFNNNGSTGLSIYSNGAITLANVVANNNTGFGEGVHLDNSGSTGDLGVTIKGVNQFNNNGANGLLVHSHGAIALNSITANENGRIGATLDNSPGVFATLPKAVTLTGTNIFNGNGTTGATYYGLSVASLGPITVSNITAINQFTGSTGVYLNNDKNGAVGGVTINGYGFFENNSDYGLKIFSRGVILLNNINANENNYGAIIDNCGANFTVTGGYEIDCDYTGKALTLNGVNNFNGNSGYGLEALSGGAIKANNLTANENGSANSWYLGDPAAPTIGNALLESELGITLTGVNTFNDNTAGEGVTLYSDKAITASNLNANGNADRGAYVSGTVTTTLTGVNTFNNNGGNGLTISDSYGAVTVSNLTANGNTSGGGALIKNDYVTATPWNATLLGANWFNGNADYGLSIQTYGAVLLNNITANNNTSGNGLLVDNHNGLATLPKPITLNGVNNFNNNGSGINLQSIGIITLNNITANANTLGGGAYIQNDSATPATATSPGVFIKGSNSFSNNTAVGATGLWIVSFGVITLNNINANNNGDYGALLTNFNTASVSKAVTITGVNNFNSNTNNYGLYIDASGSVILTRVTANNNGDDGIWVITPKTITLTCGFAYNNTSNGIYLHSTGGGLVTVKGYYAFLNGANDIDFSSPKSVLYNCALP